MNYLLDTNTITALASGHPIALRHLSSITSNDDLYTCFIVLGEWEYGIRNAQGQQQGRILAAGQPIFAALTAIWDSTPEIARQYGIFHAELRAAGQMIPTNDIWIAATAHFYTATVVTADSHFQRLGTLHVIDWTRL